MQLVADLKDEPLELVPLPGFMLGFGGYRRRHRLADRHMYLAAPVCATATPQNHLHHEHPVWASAHEGCGLLKHVH